MSVPKTYFVRANKDTGAIVLYGPLKTKRTANKWYREGIKRGWKNIVVTQYYGYASSGIDITKEMEG